MFKKIVILLLAIILLPALYALIRLRFTLPMGEVSFDVTGGRELTCSTSAFGKYQSKMIEIGDMTIASQPYDGSVSQQKQALSNYLSMRPNGLKTVIASVHVPSGEVFTHTCKEERCTIEEMFESDKICLLKHMGNCSFIAVRFRGQDTCLLDPAQER